MNQAESNIYPLLDKEQKPGLCWICEQPTIVRAEDRATGQIVGKCCVGEILMADVALSQAEGVDHPKSGKHPRS